jgi:hypothetical protein
MSDRVTTLTDPERASIITALVQIQGQLDRVGEMLAAVHISHALDCLDPDHPINGFRTSLQGG